MLLEVIASNVAGGSFGKRIKRFTYVRIVRTERRNKQRGLASRRGRKRNGFIHYNAHDARYSFAAQPEPAHTHVRMLMAPFRLCILMTAAAQGLIPPLIVRLRVRLLSLHARSTTLFILYSLSSTRILYNSTLSSSPRRRLSFYLFFLILFYLIFFFTLPTTASPMRTPLIFFITRGLQLLPKI